MDNQLVDTDEGEEIPDAFTCCVCLELLHKPIVLPCGHVSCFWCVHRSMNGLRESHCPICRQQYYHFPTICQLLHYLISKIYPATYRRRGAQILEQEKKDGVFSPQLDVYAFNSQANRQPEHLVKPRHFSEAGCESNSYPESNIKQSESVSVFQDNGIATSRPTSEGSSEPNFAATEDKTFTQNEVTGTCKQVLIADILCAACSQLLFRPVVLNCGHVYCETCIVKPPDDVLRCEVCQCPHPNGLPKVCLVLNNFLEEQFPKEYKQRKDVVQQKQVNFSNETPRSSPAEKSGRHVSERWNEPLSNVHIRVGCDNCGMYPIIGERYRCKDCTETIGFDLCGDCYNSCSKLPGRFNQQHKPEHSFELLSSEVIPNYMLRLVAERLGDSTTVFVIPNDTENLENVPPGPETSAGAEHPGNHEGPVIDAESLEDHENGQSE